jgi:uncharacterized protein
VLGVIGLMVLFDVKVNFLNAVVFTAVLGSGTDNAVHIYHRYREAGPGSIGLVLRQTGSAALLASATNAAGWGSMLLAHNAGLQSVGRVALIAYASAFFMSTVLMPAMLRLSEVRLRRP